MTSPFIDFSAEFAAVLCRHRTFQYFHETRRKCDIVGEGFGTIVYGHTGLLAEEFVVGSFIGVLIPAPPAHVIHQNRAILRLPRHDFLEKLAQFRSAMKG